MDFNNFSESFATEKQCVDYLAAQRWLNGPVCDKCGAVNDALKSENHPRYWHCRSCSRKFSITVGTPMEHSHLPLPTWFKAVYLLTSGGKKLSIMALSLQLRISYKSAWFLYRKIRTLLHQGNKIMLGILEIKSGCRSIKRRHFI